MTKRSVRDMNKAQRVRHSLNYKLMRSLIIMSVVIAIAAIAYGFTLYSLAVRREYKNAAYELSQTASVQISRLGMEQYAKRTLEKYDSFSEEEQLDQDSEAYKAAFEGIEDYGYNVMADKLGILQKYNNAKSVYIAAIDVKKMRMIYIIDSDKTSQHCSPGKWEEISAGALEIFQGNTAASLMEQLMGFKESGDAVIAETTEYGYLCTAGVLIMDVGDYMIGAFTDLDMSVAVSASFNFLWQYALILLILIAIIAFVTSRTIRKSVVRPINRLAEAAVAYSSDKMENIDSDGHFSDLDIHTGDEIENLSLVMNDMEGEMNEYISNLTSVTAEKERISTELNVAKQIQEGMVPHTYPPFPDRTEFDIYAEMNTAKEVGGDFYDYFFVDDDHLALVMADVSGKGVPAALFMMASKILIGNMSVMIKDSPAVILEKVNDSICSNNTVEMFVTVWLGILEISTGVLKAANAGHECPLIMKKDGIFDYYNDPHGLVVGGIGGIKYKEYVLKLDPGDSIFVYTDGLTEAVNSKNQLFGPDRLCLSLNKHRSEKLTDIIKNVHSDVTAFAGDAPQFDDITMMCLQYYDSPAKSMVSETVLATRS